MQDQHRSDMKKPQARYDIPATGVSTEPAAYNAIAPPIGKIRKYLFIQTMNRVLVEGRASSFLKYSGVWFDGDVGGHPPEHVGPAKTTRRAVDVVLVIGVGVMLAVVGDPADRAPLGRLATDRGHHVFEPAGPDLEAPMGQETVISQGDPQTSRDPVKDEAGEHRPP